jgi:hypothetical protein
MGVYYFQLFLPKVHEARASRDLLGGYTYGCDFYQVWLTSRELIFHRANPYTAEMTAKIQLGLFARRIDPSRPEDPRPNLALYSYPIYTDFVAAPFAFLSFRQVQIVGGLLFPLLVVASVLLWFQNLNLRASPTTLLAFLALTISSYPILEGIYALQLTFVVAALIAGAVTALMRGKMTFGGILLGVASIKPQLILLPGLFLVIWALSDFRKRKFAFLSFTGTIVVLILLGEAIIPGWFRAWIQALGEYRHYDAPPLTQLVLGRLPVGYCLSALPWSLSCSSSARDALPLTRSNFPAPWRCCWPSPSLSYPPALRFMTRCCWFPCFSGCSRGKSKSSGGAAHCAAPLMPRARPSAGSGSPLPASSSFRWRPQAR